MMTMIERLREPKSVEKLRIHVRRAAGRFELVIVNASWKPRWSADGFLPLILGRKESRLQVLGYVLPFNPVMEILTAEEQKDIFSLASYWADWLDSHRKGQMLS